jgi:hypothetical protein
MYPGKSVRQIGWESIPGLLKRFTDSGCFGEVGGEGGEGGGDGMRYAKNISMGRMRGVC